MENKKKEPKELQELVEKITKGFEIAYQKMLEFKKSKNSPVVLFRNGKIEEVRAEELMKNQNLP